MKETRFKQTDIGLVPEDWEITTLGKACDMPTVTIDTDTFNNNLYISTENLLQNCQGMVPYRGEITYKRVREYRSGDSLVSNIRPNLHKTFYAQQIGGCSTDVIVFRPKEGLDSRILYAIICNQRYAATVAAEAVGTKMPRGDKNTIRSYTFAIPKELSEQRRIAEVLGHVDGLLVRLDKLIAKKKTVKKGAMQQLLTGRTRLKGFSEPWKEVKLGEIWRIQKGQSLSSKDFVDGHIPVVAGGKTYAGYHITANIYGPSITISASGAYAGYVWYHKEPIFASDCFAILDNNLYDLLFLYNWLRCQQKNIYKSQMGGAQPHVHPKDIQDFIIILPPITEQRAISRILIHMDKEIEALQAERRKVEQVKKGMMQQLLTGKIRLTD